MVKLLVTFKWNTSVEWASEKFEKIGLDGSRFSYFLQIPGSPRMVVEVAEEDELKYSRAIRMISPQVISVSRA